MLNKHPKSEPAPDPDQMMVGVCQLCKTEIRMERWKTQAASSHSEMGAWRNQPCAECLVCKEASLKKIGTKVMMVVDKRKQT